MEVSRGKVNPAENAEKHKQSRGLLSYRQARSGRVANPGRHLGGGRDEVNAVVAVGCKNRFAAAEAIRAAQRAEVTPESEEELRVLNRAVFQQDDQLIALIAYHLRRHLVTRARSPVGVGEKWMDEDVIRRGNDNHPVPRHVNEISGADERMVRDFASLRLADILGLGGRRIGRGADGDFARESVQPFFRKIRLIQDQADDRAGAKAENERRAACYPAPRFGGGWIAQASSFFFSNSEQTAGLALPWVAFIT